MSSQILSDFIYNLSSNTAKLKKISKRIKESKLLYFTGLTGSARNFLISYIINSLNVPVLIVTPDITGALRTGKDLENLTSRKIDFLTSHEASPYETVYKDPELTKQQLCILNDFKESPNNIIIIPAKTLLNTYVPQESAEQNSLKLKTGDAIDTYEAADILVTLGYQRVTMVMDPGEFSLRGDILDIYPITGKPVRIEFFGDDIQDIRLFDIDTQKSIEHIKEITITQRYKVVIEDNDKNTIIEKISQIAHEQKANLEGTSLNTLEETIQAIISNFETSNYFEGIEYFAPLISNNNSNIIDYLPQDTLVITIDSPEYLQRLQLQHDKYIQEYEKNINEGLALKLPELLHKTPEFIINNLKSYKNINIDSFVQDEPEFAEELESKMIPKFLANLDNASNFIYDLRTADVSVLVVSEYPQRVSEVLKEWECPNRVLDPEDNLNIDELLASRDILISRQGFAEGFHISEIDFAVITDTELFNKKVKKPTMAKRVSKRENIDYYVSLNDLNDGDYVVHVKHGIGKFVGLSKHELDGQLKDYLSIEYARGDKLYVPAEQINLLSRYRGAGNSAPKLTKMGGAEWNTLRRKVKKAIDYIAADLIKIYAKRTQQTGFVYDGDSPWQLEMEDAFPFAETPDQLQAIVDTKADMESEKIMDRLVCGDVGFGKTEVAMRAIFKSILSSKQAILLCPTTILAQQHYNTFVDRFKPYPIKIELLSRFRTAKQIKETLKNLLTGECDLAIGTHRLLQKDVEFKNLGLMIIDEEHRFGVRHKEKLKELKTEVDVLTLSATPIPRTLYMSLSGVRDMSLINTPPINRAPIKTYVGQYNESMLRTAINHELEREGQVYFVHNRVESIYKVALELQKMIPEARVAIGHGQMPEKELEKVMYEFSNHEYDVLVCTTIIESGLDIPNANTLIVDDADKFGLAQLYQIRGRVGRSDVQAYAYCFYRKNKMLTPEAKDRLKAIKEFTTLGSGYQIALRDLEIRGVGNILGSQQHGHMITVGFDLYCQLLEDAIKQFSGETVERKEPPVVDINVTAYLPDTWVGDKEQKMIEYKRLADVQSIKELQYIESEWKDRFGKIPDEVSRLIQIIRVRLYATEIGINLIREAAGTIRIYADYNVYEWRLYQSKLPKQYARKFKWTKAPATSENGKSIIIFNNLGLLPEEQLDIIEETIYTILDIKNIKK